MARKHSESCLFRVLPLVVLVLFAPVGCVSWRDSGPMKLASKVDVPDGVPWKREKVRRGMPRRMVATWTDTVKQQPGSDAERGFGGRIFFYDRDESEPIGVEGQLVVYAYDETDRLPTDNHATKRYVFPPDQFKLHESGSELGVSYSVWLPWDSVGGAQTDVSLMARFEPIEGGALIVSEMTRERLPGQLKSSEVMVAQNTGPAQSKVTPAGYSAVIPAGIGSNTPAPAKKSGLQTTTIRRPDAAVKY